MKVQSVKAHHYEKSTLPKVDFSLSQTYFIFSGLSLFYFACYHKIYEQIALAKISGVGQFVDDERSLALAIGCFLLLQPLV